MRITRKARLSIYRTLKDIFEDGTLMGDAWHVYNEYDLRNGTVIERPCVTILDFGMNFDMKNLPVIVVQSTIVKRPLEMGTSNTYFVYAALQVFGRNRGERDDLASAIMEIVEDIEIRDFDTTGEPIVQTMGLEYLNTRGDRWISEQPALPRSLITEESMANWTSLSCGFFVTDATA